MHGNTIQLCADSQLLVMEDVLAMAELDSGKMATTPAWYDSLALVEEVVSPLRKRAIANKLQLTVRFKRSLPSQLRRDSVHVSQILRRLIRNAVKFSRVGAIIVEVSFESRRPDVGPIARQMFGILGNHFGVESTSAKSSCLRFAVPVEAVLPGSSGHAGVILTRVAGKLEINDCLYDLETCHGLHRIINLVKPVALGNHLFKRKSALARSEEVECL